METLSALLTIWEGHPPVTGGFPSQRACNVFFVDIEKSPYKTHMYVNLALELLSWATSRCVDYIVGMECWGSDVNTLWPGATFTNID